MQRLSEGTILQIERGDRKTGPNPTTLTAIAQALEVHPAELLGAPDLSPQATEAARILDGLDEPRREAALAVLRAIARD